jgi:hypothetical protein
MLMIIWALGLVCGVVTLPGLLVAAVDLVLLAWAYLAMGFNLSLRPGPTSVAASRSAAIGTVSLLAHAALLAGLLASPPEFAVFQTWPVWIRSAIVLAGCSILFATSLLAWFLTRQTLARFDEWVGRPIKRGAGGGDARSPIATGHALT